MMKLTESTRYYAVNMEWQKFPATLDGIKVTSEMCGQAALSAFAHIVGQIVDHSAARLAAAASATGSSGPPPAATIAAGTAA